MTFNSLPYLLFLPTVVVGYWALPRRVRQVWLLGASYLFYGAFDWRFLGLLLFTTTVDYCVGVVLDRDRGGASRHRRAVLSISVLVNLGVLGVFKYFNFFVDQAVELLGSIGLSATAPGIRLILPYGISFYTFQSIGYTVDVYRRRIPACRNVVDFATFVAYFPQLVAGPISRAEKLLPQIRADRPRPNPSQISSGLMLILLGLAKKVVIADPLAPVVSRLFDGRSSPGPAMVVVGMVAFALQIYADFSGYTDMARGTSRLLNIELVHNFTQPYFSRNVTEFWRRWHISLSTWLRDYLYVPLGGNRGSPARTYRNLMLTMVLGGLWHGAGWNFVIWGFLHGTYLAVERARGVRQHPDGLPPRRDIPLILWTFALVCFAWVFFRAADLGQALHVLGGLVDLSGTAPTAGEYLLVAAWATAVVLIDRYQRAQLHPLPGLLGHPVRTGLLAAAAVVGVIIFSGGAPVKFIYFQF